MMPLITDFKAYLSQAGYGQSSQSMLPAMLADFLSYHNLSEINQTTPHHISQYHQHLQERPNKHQEGGLSESYIHHHVFALKVFFNWLEESGQLAHNPISALKFTQPGKKSREPLSPEAVQQLFAAAKNLKERAVLHLFYSCGLRRSEGHALNTKDIHFKQQLLYVRSGKGAKRRAVPMPAQVAADLENYYRQQRIYQVARNDESAFMLNKLGNRMHGQGYQKILKELIVRAGLPEAITLHHLRHSITTHLLENGMTVELLRQFLGHSFLETTQIYAKVSKQQILKL
ncbi:tyrosine-type recombinase/integrase [Desertivirga xinjiangensis]|uniref:tyrosine-type recombinase/integrase n=1 Tax=Desertivirga xinjiangensis TaxID=539206 RepID=UPI00210F03CB|nr:tyrosine-type recombinase/integrase [Pedobacter xinjiangensis]